MLRVLVLGAGATGGYFGGRLVEAGGDVTFLVRPARAARLAANGLRITSPEGDFHAPVATVTAAVAPHDLVILSCKAYDLEDAVASIAPAVGPETSILPLLNGILHLDRLDAAFGAARVLGGFCHIGATLAENGDIHHLSKLHALTFGERSGLPTARTAAIASLFARGRFVSRESARVVPEMWEKFAFLTTLASVTCLMRANVGTILSTQDGESIMRETYDECRAVAAASGWPIPADGAAMALEQLTLRGSASTASMLRDIRAGRRIEADHVVGDMLRRARALGVPAPLLRIAFCNLQSYATRT